ncbi:FecR family protein [Chitinophaga arvensicola]|uniref:FecR protein n=1 Tax=Chitinophaga arvensicola TaxID=29529 RepID=A0A1I0S6G6_9BACT|nr:FecR domain-containing protein [Chitinophaga arvensicola]SEW51081.1 FecR protein [Chitinophaga arvensicola]
MNKHENHHEIDWDKLLDKLDGSKANTSLNEEELAMLAAAKEMQSRIGAEKFPANAGWESFVQARDRKRARRFSLVKLAAAATLVLAIATVWWMLSRRQQAPQLANEMPAASVRLKLADGHTVTLGDNKQVIPHNGIAAIKADQHSAVYDPAATQHAVTGMDTLEVPRGLQFSLQLSDGTRVQLNAGTTLIYPAAFNGATREVAVKGEAYFEVAADIQRPFTVHAGMVTMKVLGTAFNVNTYTPELQTTLSSGKLLVAAGQQQTLLSPGEQSVYNSQSTTLQKRTVETRLFTAWAEGDLFFEDASLRDISTYLSRTYDYTFIFEDPALEKVSFTLDMRRPPALQDVLNQISRSMGQLRFRTEGRTVYIMK